MTDRNGNTIPRFAVMVNDSHNHEPLFWTECAVTAWEWLNMAGHFVVADTRENKFLSYPEELQ